jgi:hypothetical protein
MRAVAHIRNTRQVNTVLDGKGRNGLEGDPLTYKQQVTYTDARHSCVREVADSARR